MKNEGGSTNRRLRDIELPQPHLSYHKIYDRKDKQELVLLIWTIMIRKEYFIKEVCINRCNGIDCLMCYRQYHGVCETMRRYPGFDGKQQACL